MPERGLLNALPAPIQPVAGEADDVERIHHGDRVGQLFGGGGLEAAEPVHRDDLDPISPLFRPLREPLLEHCLRASLDHVQQSRGAGLVPHGGEVDDDRDVFVALARVTPDMLVDTDGAHAVETVRVID